MSDLQWPGFRLSIHVDIPLERLTPEMMAELRELNTRLEALHRAALEPVIEDVVPSVEPPAERKAPAAEPKPFDLPADIQKLKPGESVIEISERRCEYEKCGLRLVRKRYANGKLETTEDFGQRIYCNRSHARRQTLLAQGRQSQEARRTAEATAPQPATKALAIKEKVLAVLQAQAGTSLTAAELEAEVGCSRASVVKATQALLEAGQIERMGEGGPGLPYLYLVRPALPDRPAPVAAPVEPPDAGPKRSAKPVKFPDPRQASDYAPPKLLSVDERLDTGTCPECGGRLTPFGKCRACARREFWAERQGVRRPQKEGQL